MSHGAPPQYPSREQQKAFAATYIKAWGLEDRPAQFDDEFLAAVNCYALGSHFMWALWGVINAASPIPFGYLEYSIARLEQFELQKASLISLHLHEVSLSQAYIQANWRDLSTI